MSDYTIPLSITISLVPQALLGENRAWYTPFEHV